MNETRKNKLDVFGKTKAVIIGGFKNLQNISRKISLLESIQKSLNRFANALS